MWAVCSCYVEPLIQVLATSPVLLARGDTFAEMMLNPRSALCQSFCFINPAASLIIRDRISPPPVRPPPIPAYRKSDVVKLHSDRSGRHLQHHAGVKRYSIGE